MPDEGCTALFDANLLILPFESIFITCLAALWRSLRPFDPTAVHDHLVGWGRTKIVTGTRRRSTLCLVSEIPFGFAVFGVDLWFAAGKAWGEIQAPGLPHAESV